MKVFHGAERLPADRSRHRQKLYDQKSRQVNQILTQSFSQSPTATSIISNRKLGKWRSYWDDLVTYYDNTTELAGVNHQEFLINLHRQDNEDIKDFIVRLDNAITNCRTHHIPMSNSLLNSKLKNNTKGYMKSMVLMKISDGKTFNEIKSEVLNMSNSDSNNEMDNDNTNTYVNNNITTKYNNKNADKSVYKSHPNLIKNKFNNTTNNNQYNKQNNSTNVHTNSKCIRCLNWGHTDSECKTDLKKFCTNCKKYGHTIQSCKYHNNIQAHNVYTSSNNSNDQLQQLITMLKPLLINNTTTTNNDQNNIQSNNTTNRPIRTITMNSNGGYNTND